MKHWPGRKQPKSPERRGSSHPSASVFSYHASRSRQEAPVGRRQGSSKPTKKHRLTWRTIPSLLALAAIIYSLGYVFILDTNPKIVILGGQQQAQLLQATEVYQRAAQDILAESASNRTKLTVNTDAVADELKRRFPEISTVAVTVPLASHRLIFELEAASPALILASRRSGAFVVDNAGRAVVRTKDVPAISGLNLPQVTDETGLELAVGKAVLTEEQITFITEVIRQLDAKSISVQNLTLPPQADELHVRVKGGGYYVKFHMSGDARLQAGTFMAIREGLDKDGVKPKTYIDVRVPEKAFYK